MAIANNESCLFRVISISFVQGYGISSDISYGLTAVQLQASAGLKMLMKRQNYTYVLSCQEYLASENPRSNLNDRDFSSAYARIRKPPLSGRLSFLAPAVGFSLTSRCAVACLGLGTFHHVVRERHDKRIIPTK